MSYTISLSGLEIEFKYSSGYELLSSDTSYYFIQIVIDQKYSYTFAGPGIPNIDTESVNPGQQVFILTVFGDASNIILMPTVFLKNVTPYQGLTLYAFVNDDKNKIKISNIPDVMKEKNNNIFLYTIDSNNNIVSKVQNNGSSVFAMYQAVSKNLAVDIPTVPGDTDSMAKYIDASVNTQVDELIINTNLYNYLINTTMPLYFNNNKDNESQVQKKTTSSSTVSQVIVIIILLFIIAVVFVGVWMLLRHHKNPV